MGTYQLYPAEFLSKGTRCRGDLYLPDGVTAPLVVIMAHGLAAERKFRLPAYADVFASNGLAVFLFDYRCFGDSEGTPRHLVDPQRHVADWLAAIQQVRGMSEVNGRCLAIWGSSFGGGHVLVAAAKDQQVQAVVSQVPYINSITTIPKLGLRFLLQSTPHALQDVWRIITRQPPYMVKVIAPPDAFAVMNTPESYPGYSAIIPEGSTWRNECPARILLTFALYRPKPYAAKINCPVLLMTAKQDSLVSAADVASMSHQMQQVELVEYPFGHFDIYVGQPFAEAVKHQTDFLLDKLVAG